MISWTDTEQIKRAVCELATDQQAYDAAVFEANDTSYEEIKKKEGFYHAILDEVGEWNHVRKDSWCWWKRTQEPADPEKELEEYADLLHFALSFMLAEFKDVEAIGHNVEDLYDWYNWAVKQSDYYTPAMVTHMLLKSLLDEFFAENLLLDVLFLGRIVGYSFDDIYKAYKKKNKTNWERLRNGY